jgi:hypothetical protein
MAEANMKVNRNPFRYGAPVSGEHYYERKELRQSVLNFLTNQVSVVLYGSRRLGKTSFLLDLERHLKDNYGIEPIIIDTYNVTSHRDFLIQVLSAVAQKRTAVAKITNWVKSLPSQLSPALQLQASPVSGEVTWNIGLHKTSDADVKELILQALRMITALDEKTCVIIDEFQKIGLLDDDGWLEATIRTTMQFTNSSVFLFSGSQHGILSDMFSQKSRPFYRSSQSVEFTPIDDNLFTKWIIHKFSSVEIKAQPAAIDYLREQVDQTTNYIQMACFHLVAKGVSEVNKQEVDSILQQMASQGQYAYGTLLASLPPVHQRVLRMVALEGQASSSLALMQKYEIKNPPHVSAAVKSIAAKQILNVSSSIKNASLDDPLVAVWLRHEFCPKLECTQPVFVAGGKTDKN